MFNKIECSKSEFIDDNGQECSIQISSSAMDEKIWLGVNEPSIMILATDAKKLGFETDTDVGWVEFSLPENAYNFGRMHLTREQVGELLPFLVYFYETGSINVHNK